MRRALVGHTGFVGSNLLAAGGYDALFNSRNAGTMAGDNFDELVCAATPAVKWAANRDPDEDRASIARLIAALERTRIGRFVLISTIDVYPDPSQPVDEDFDPTGIENHPYGLNRLALEHWAADRFPDCAIVRLPALFGPGLKKNIIFDLLHDNQVEKIDPKSAFQWYPTTALPRHLRRIEEAGLRLVNLFPEPIETQEIVGAFFPAARIGTAAQKPARYGLKTKYAETFGGREGYAMNREQVLAELGRYIDGETRGQSTPAAPQSQALPQAEPG